MVEVDPRIGTEIAGYRVETMLGSGGMAVAYRARDQRLNRPVALGLLNPELGADERFRERLLREPKLAASLDHSNIAQVVAVHRSVGTSAAAGLLLGQVKPAEAPVLDNDG